MKNNNGESNIEVHSNKKFYLNPWENIYRKEEKYKNYFALSLLNSVISSS